MPTVDIPEYGTAEFPDSMSPDEIKGVIQQKFYSKPQLSDDVQSGLAKLQQSPEGSPGYADIANQPEVQAALSYLKPPPSQEAGSVLGKLPRVEQQDTILGQVAGGVSNVAANVAESLTTPQNLALLPLTTVRGVGRLAALAFGGQMLSDVPQAFKETIAPDKTVQQRIESGGRTLSDILFGVAGVGHGIGLELPTSDKSVLTETPQTLSDLVEPIIRSNESTILAPEVPLASEVVAERTTNAIQEPTATEVGTQPIRTESVWEKGRQGVGQGEQGQQAPQAQPQVTTDAQATNTVRLYHGGSGEQAGSDFTTSLQYAQDYAAKTPNGKVWFVDVPDGVLKTHDEYGQPMTRVVVPDEIANQAEPISPQTEGAGEAASSAIPPPAPSTIEVPAQETKALPELKSTEEAISYGQSPEANSEALRAEHQRLLKQAEVETGDTKVATITKAQLFREAAETAEKQRTDTTGISQAAHEQRGAKVATGEGASPEEMIQRGRELRSSGADPEPIAQKIEQGQPISADETAVLRARVEELSKDSNRLQDEANANPFDEKLQQEADDAFKSEVEFRQRIKPAATEWAKTGAAYQGETNIDTGSFTGLRRAVQDIKGRDATPTEQIKLKEVAGKVQKTEAAVIKAKGAFDEAIKKETSQLASRSSEELRNYFAEKFRAMTPCV